MWGSIPRAGNMIKSCRVDFFWKVNAAFFLRAAALFGALPMEVRAFFNRGGENMKTGYVLEQQLELLLAALFPDNRRVVQVMLRTGLRVSDVLSLRKEQLARQFWVTESKTGKRMHCGLPEWLIEDIKAAAGGSVWAFPSPVDGRKHRTRQAVWKDLKRAARALRIHSGGW